MVNRFSRRSMLYLAGLMPFFPQIDANSDKSDLFSNSNNISWPVLGSESSNDKYVGRVAKSSRVQ